MALSYHAGMHPSADIGAGMEQSELAGVLHHHLFDKGHIKSYSSRNAVVAFSFSCTFEMILVSSDLISIPLS